MTYLIDANSFIEANRRYYAEDIVPSYWMWLQSAFPNTIYVIDKVRDEIIGEDDFLSNWLKLILEANPQNLIYTKSNQDIINCYAKVIQYISSCDLFQDESYSQWLEVDKADPYLIATAMNENASIVTMEQRVGNLSRKNPMKKEPHIPNVADYFNVECINLFEFMRRTSCSI